MSSQDQPIPSAEVAAIATKLAGEIAALAKVRPLDAAELFERRLRDRGALPAWTFDRALHHLSEPLLNVDEARLRALEDAFENAEVEDREAATVAEPDWAAAQAIVDQRQREGAIIERIRSQPVFDWRPLARAWKEVSAGSSDIAAAILQSAEAQVVAIVQGIEDGEISTAIWNLLATPSNLQPAMINATTDRIWAEGSSVRTISSRASIILGMERNALNLQHIALSQAPRTLTRWEMRSSLRASEDAYEAADTFANEHTDTSAILTSVAKAWPLPVAHVGGALKRAFDVMTSLALIVMLSPILIAVGVAAALSSPGPLVYAHRRIGRGGKEFSCFKFRTMVVNGEQVLQRLLESDPSAAEEWRTMQMLRDDPRVTGVGRFLRRSALDELPQLFNVLLGDMSLVGPRAITRTEIARYGDLVSYYFMVRPGITGLWQVSGRNSVSYETRVQLDRRYVEGWSWGGDIKILWNTIPAIFNAEAL